MIRISVAMAVYNSEKYIIPQIESILNQLGENDELVVSYNESDDRTLEIISKYAENNSKIKIVYCKEKGFRPNFNSAIINCGGTYIFLSDHDDVWRDDKVDHVIQAFEKYNADLILHGHYRCDRDLNIKEVILPDSNKIGFLSTLISNSYTGCCMAFRSSLVKYICPLPNKVVFHDAWIGMIANIIGSVSIINEPLLYYRRHGENESFERRRSLFPILKERFISLFFVIARVFKIVFHIRSNKSKH